LFVSSPADEKIPGAKDGELVRATLGGADNAFAVLYRRYAPAITRRLKRMLGAIGELEDVVQSVFIAAFRSLRRFDLHRSFGAWLHGIAANVAQRYRRARRRSRWLLLPGEESPPEPAAVWEAEAALDAKASVVRVRARLPTVAEPARTAFVLHRLDGLSLKEVAAICRVSEQTAWARVKSAERQLRRHVRRDLVEEGID
jgi:RNA polymerase sigma factor CnrH